MSSASEPSFSIRPIEPAALVATRKTVQVAQASPAIAACAVVLRKAMEQPDDQQLALFESYAILGVSAGFVERHLSPHLMQHQAIIAPMIEEIRSVYAQLIELGSPYDKEEFKLRAFHYGVHKASYLDWQLYLSKECY